MNDARQSPVLVVFGITGDLARKKIFAALYELARCGQPLGRVIGVGRSDWTTEDLRRVGSKAIADSADRTDDVARNAVLASMCYLQGDYGEAKTFEAIAELVVDSDVVLSYFAVPPIVFSALADGLASTPLADRVRLLVEKPFGTDRNSACELQSRLEASFSQSQIFVVDHYLEKDVVQILSCARRDNALLDTLWGCERIESVEILMAEDFGIDGRGGFFDSTGTLRDTIQSHGLQLLCAVAMEPPAGDTEDALHDARTQLLRAVAPLRLEDVVLGQYGGYRDAEGVDPSSTTETYVRATIRIDNDRWRNVRFSLISGKELKQSRVSVTLTFRPPPPGSAESETPLPETLVIDLAPKELVSEDQSAPKIDLRRPTDPYARMFGDALRGDHTWFARHDVVVESWRVVQDVLAHGAPVIYTSGSWGPET